MTTHTPLPGSLRVCAIVAPGTMVATEVRDIEEATNLRSFLITAHTLSQTHGVGGEFSYIVVVQQFNGEEWELPSVDTSEVSDKPWHVHTPYGVFGFASHASARYFARRKYVVTHATQPLYASDVNLPISQFVGGKTRGPEFGTCGPLNLRSGTLRTKLMVTASTEPSSRQRLPQLRSGAWNFSAGNSRPFRIFSK